MESRERINPKALVLFATPMGASVWVASGHLAIGLGLAVIATGVFLSIVRGDW